MPKRENLRLQQQYKEAQAAGRGQQFLKAHRKFARNLRNPDRRYSALRKPVRKSIRAEEQVAEEQAKKQIGYYNPTVRTAFGESGVSFDEQGNPVYTEEMSQPQQDILRGGEQLTQTGQQMAQEQLGQYQPYGGADSFNRGRFESQVFDRLTRNLSKDYQDRRQQTEQDLFNRGIPMDPNDPSYEAAMEDVERQFQEEKERAAGQAVTMGGSEMQREHQIGLGTHQQRMSDIGSLQQQGTGLIGYQGPGYQAPQYNLPSPTDVSMGQRQLRLQRRGQNIQKRLADAQIGQMNRPAPSYNPQPAPPPGPVFN